MCENSAQVAMRSRFCPYDATEMESRCDKDGVARPTCITCGFVDYGNPAPCVAVLVERNGAILLARRKFGPRQGFWDIPGGFVDVGESAETCVRREIMEETGLELANVRYLTSVEDTYGPFATATLNLCFTAESRAGDPQEGSDVAELRWFPIDDLPGEMAFAHQRELLDEWSKGLKKCAVETWKGG